MATPDELRAAIAEGRAALRTALQAAAPRWEQPPAPGEGEQAWSPRQAAEHVIGAEVFFARAVCKACGYAGPDGPWGREGPQLASAAAAATALEQAADLADGKIKHVSAADLAHPHERLGTVEAAMALWASHLHDHAGQIRAASQ